MRAFGPQQGAPAHSTGGRVALPPEFIFPFLEELDSFADSPAASGRRQRANVTLAF